MKIIPAIDLLGGAAVRLREGRRDQKTAYSDEPWKLAAKFVDAGAERIHIVDLDGAFSGHLVQRELIERIVHAVRLPVQVGGGIRDRAALEAVFATGARFAILGTAAVKDPAFVEEACKNHPSRVIVAVDARDGVVAVEGWTETSEITAAELGVRAADWGAAALLYTDVARDGTHTGPNVEATAELVQKVGWAAPVIASGGVGSLEDIGALAAAGVPMAVVGSALYEHRFTLEEAIGAAVAPPPPG